MQMLSNQKLPLIWDVADGHMKGLGLLFLENMENYDEEEWRRQPSKFSNLLGRQINTGAEESEKVPILLLRMVKNDR